MFIQSLLLPQKKALKSSERGKRKTEHRERKKKEEMRLASDEMLTSLHEISSIPSTLFFT